MRGVHDVAQRRKHFFECNEVYTSLLPCGNLGDVQRCDEQGWPHVSLKHDFIGPTHEM